jgi:hypothetical protein
MTKAKKILIVVGVIGVAIGGFVLVKYLNRNTKNYKYYEVEIKDTEEPILSSEDVE